MFKPTNLLVLRQKINNLCHFLFCSHKTDWAPFIFKTFIYRYSLDGVVICDEKLIQTALELLSSIKWNDDFNEYDCHGYVYKIYYEPIQTILNKIIMHYTIASTVIPDVYWDID
jgi:hypothetical protein